MKSKFTILLFDNGSLRPEATLALRDLATNLSDRLCMPVEAVSLLHSHKIDKSKLNGKPATIIRRRLKLAIVNNEHRFICLPLFLGPSLAITNYLKKLIDELVKISPQIDIRVAPPLAGWNVEMPDIRLVEIIKDHVTRKLDNNRLKGPIKVALLDHGSPIEKLAVLRNCVADKLRPELNKKGVEIVACSMERRKGELYAFNDPLLETIDLSQDRSKSIGCLVVAMFFLLPGRHAGEGGDVDGILKNLVLRGKIKDYNKTSLIGEHPLIYSILEERVEQAIAG